MLKIMNIISDTNIGGAGKCLVYFASNFNTKEYEVSVVLPKNSALMEQLKKTPVKLTEIDGLKDKSWDFFSLGKLMRIIKKEKPDIVHTHASFTARVAARLVGNTKIVYTRHCAYPVSNFIKSGPGHFLYQHINEYFADRIIAVGNAAEENLLEGGIHQEKIETFFNGVEKIKKTSEEEKNKLKKKYHVAADEKIVGIVARLEEVKGQEVFLDAAKILIKEKQVKAKFFILGTGTMEEKLKQKVKEMGIESQVIFTGFVKNVGDFLNIFDVQVNCSFGTETSSLSLLEGMSIGVPAVASDYGGNPYIIRNGENGLIVPIKDAEKTAEAILEILENQEKSNEMKKKAVQIYEENYTVQKYTENVQNVYEKVSKQPGKKKINPLDILLILIALVAVIGGYRFLKRTSNVETTSTQKVIYQVMASEVIPEVSDMVELNTLIYDSTKNECIGTVIAKEARKSIKYDASIETGEYVPTELEDKIDLTLTIEANAHITNQNIEVGNYEVKVGNTANVKGKGYAASGYVIKIER